MASRNPDDLHPDLQPIYRKFAAEAKKEGLDFILTCTWRSDQEQDELYASGRTKPGKKLTNAKAGQSAHNFVLGGSPAARAFDIVPMENGKCMWDEGYPAWKPLGKIGMDLGLNWYGAPGAKFHEEPHFEMKG